MPDWTLEPLHSDHAEAVARLHIEGIATGFISSLGLRFVTALYETIARSNDAIGLVACQDGNVIGFVTFTTNLNRLYKQMLRGAGLRFAGLLAVKMFRWSRIKRVFETLLYPQRVEKLDLPAAELLSIVVAADGRGKGVARELIQHGLQACKQQGIDQVKVLVAAENAPANSLYQKCGFNFAAQIDSHGIASNIYIAAITDRVE